MADAEAAALAETLHAVHPRSAEMSSRSTEALVGRFSERGGRVYGIVSYSDDGEVVDVKPCDLKVPSLTDKQPEQTLEHAVSNN